MIDKQRIEDELNKFFVWPGKDKSVVSTVSAQLFARHIANIAQAEAANTMELLRTAIHKTLDDNAHLADGENCTLIALKIALREIGEPWGGE